MSPSFVSIINSSAASTEDLSPVNDTSQYKSRSEVDNFSNRLALFS